MTDEKPKKRVAEGSDTPLCIPTEEEKDKMRRELDKILNDPYLWRGTPKFLRPAKPEKKS